MYPDQKNQTTSRKHILDYSFAAITNFQNLAYTSNVLHNIVLFHHMPNPHTQMHPQEIPKDTPRADAQGSRTVVTRQQLMGTSTNNKQ